jgi:hypothetical protein
VALTDHAESSLPPFEIAGRRGWEQSRVSHQVDQTVKRAAVAATKAGRQAITSAAPGHVAAVRELFVDRLTDAQLATIASAAHDVLSLVDPAAREQRPSGTTARARRREASDAHVSRQHKSRSRRDELVTADMG